jgi:L-amino acid N-acyltransferase YncA
MACVTTRQAVEADAVAIATIYCHYARHSNATWEYTAPSVEEMTDRLREKLTLGFPAIVAVQAPSSGAIPTTESAVDAPTTGAGAIADSSVGNHGDAVPSSETVVGYAWVSPFRARPGYRFTVENTVYVAPGSHRRGIGRLLLEELIERCKRTGFRNIIASISVDDATGEGGASMKLHGALGFKEVARFPGIGWKCGKWLAAVFMQLSIGDGIETPPSDADLPPALRAPEGADGFAPLPFF